ncbi:hypothetical protein [Aquincola tertiaricarbonis]|uniref:hypothetical protein n=1 Tax=Aquincola tertiaricarbonis TaxID=391953 RepID=UPI0006149BEA|nr:hypothetical protein [Aquincola tertiaricarbonis]
MTFEFHEPIEATLKSVTPRTEKHGEDDVLALSMGLAITGPNTLLDRAFPGLRHSIYMAVEGQPQLPGVEEATPKLRTNLMELVQLSAKYEGWTLTVDHGIDEDDPIALGGCRVDKFRVRPMEGGSVELLFRIGSNDIDSEEAGQLFGKLHQTISIRLKAPEKPADVIDGTVGHPGLAAQRAEDAGQQRLDVDTEAERHADDATGAFLGLHGNGDDGSDGTGGADGDDTGDGAGEGGADLAGASPAERAAAEPAAPARSRRRTAAQQFIDQHAPIE